MSTPTKIIVLLLSYVSTAVTMYSAGRQSAQHECHVEIMARDDDMRKSFSFIKEGLRP
jgi:hypothetical protein